MHKVWPFLLAAAMLILSVPVSGAVGLTLDAIPQNPRIGDTVMLSGKVTGINTIAVYLFVTGPGLDPRGVTLDNLNIAAGKGLFTTAPVNMDSGGWSYTWDTSVILGTLKPGNYTIHVVSSPFEPMRFSEDESASARIMFLEAPVTRARAAPDPLLPVIACGIAMILLFSASLRRT